MRTNPTQTLFKSIALALLLSTLNSQLSAFAQGTAFTYQGRLSETGNLANGTYDFLMSLWNAGSGGSRVTSASNPLVITGVAVSNGLFTVMLDFGDGVFTGPPRWLEIAVNTNGASSFATLRPRQPLTAAPYATTAGNVTGVVPAGSIGGTYTNGVTFNNSANSFTGSGASLSSVNAVTVGGIASSNIWRLGGNSGNPDTRIGTLDSEPLRLIAGNRRVLQAESASRSTGPFNRLLAPNILAGSDANSIWDGVLGATISGGGETVQSLLPGLKYPNIVSDDFGTIGGGLSNRVGNANTDFTDAQGGTIGGGQGNSVAASGGTIGGGVHNAISDFNAVIAGGANNIADANASVIAGGSENHTSGDHSAIGGGQGNVVEPFTEYATIGGGDANIITTLARYATIAGGWGNSNSGGGSTIAGGAFNTSSGVSATVAGGWNNTGGGDYTAIGGGGANSAGGYNSTIGGGQFNTNNGYVATIAGGGYNFAHLSYGTVAGGLNNRVDADGATIGGGIANTNIGTSATISGGASNTANGEGAIIGGGFGNLSGNYYSTVGGGRRNTNIANSATIGGGEQNFVDFDWGTIGGGYLNNCGGAYATVPGGAENYAAGHFSFAAGRQAKALHQGSFVWADSQVADFSSTANNQFSIRAAGGARLNDDTSLSFGATTRQMLNLWGNFYGIGVQNTRLYFRTAYGADDGFAWFHSGAHSDSPDDPGPGGTELMKLDGTGQLTVLGKVCAQNLSCSSDRNVKAGFEAIDSKSILEKLVALPITRWHYTNDVATPHIGPMAQDFSAAFKLGADDKHIATVDADGVAIAAIQGLNQVVKEKGARIQALERTVAELKQLVTRFTEVNQPNR